MTRYELYIDGEKMDIGNVDISLNYKSNLLTDISKIVSNNSYTIKLPKTSRNMRLIEMAHLPSSGSVFPYIEHAATLVKNGIEIIRNANVVLMAVNESIEAAITWGTASNFASIVNDDKSLQDLDYGMSPNTDYVEWEKGSGYSSLYPRVEYGFRGNADDVWVHPVVTVKWIIDKIASTYGITFDFPSDRISMMESMIVPLLSRNDAQRQIDSNAWLMQCIGNEEISRQVDMLTARRRRFLFANPASSYYVEYKFYETGGIGGSTIGFNPKFRNVKAHITWDVKLKAHSLVPYDNDFAPNIVLFNPANNKAYATFVPSEKILIEDKGGNGNVYEFVFNIDEDVDLVDDEQNAYDLSNYLEFSTNEYIAYNVDSAEAGAMLFSPYSGTIDLGVDDKVNSRFYFVPNLPDMKQIDFLKAIAWMLGMFAIPSDTGTIRFIPFDTLDYNKPDSVDWSGKLIKVYRETMPREISYQLDNMAQKNRFKYKEDDTVTRDYDGTVIVDDKNLEYENDAVELEFAASSTRNGVAYIPIYSYNENGELEYDSGNVEPRILMLSGTDGIFEPLAWNNLLDDYYATYKGFVRRPKVIKEYIKLNPVELKNLDLTVPVYLKQYGSYWVIISVKTKKNDICEVKLLKM